MDNSLHHRLASGITWNVIGALFSQGSLFLCNIVLANILGRKGYGEFGMIQNTIVTLASVSQLATGFAATKYVAEFRFTDTLRTGRILGLCSAVTSAMGCLATVILLIIAPWLATHTLNAPYLSVGLMMASGSVFFSILNGYQLGALAGLESYGVIARISTLHGILHLLVCSVAALLWGINGAVLGFVLSALLRWLIFNRALIKTVANQSINIIYQGMWNERDIIFKFALPAALSGLFSMPALWIVNTMLVRQPDGYSQMGLYSAANNLKTLIIYLPQLVNNVGMSLMNSQKGLGNQTSYRHIFLLNLKLTAAIVVVSAIIVAFSGNWILRIYGKDFVAGYFVLLVLTLSTIPEALALAAYQVIQSQGKMWLSFGAVVLPRDLVNLAAAYVLIPTFGAKGLASAYTLSQMVALTSILIIVFFLGLDCASNKFTPRSDNDSS